MEPSKGTLLNEAVMTASECLAVSSSLFVTMIRAAESGSVMVLKTGLRHADRFEFSVAPGHLSPADTFVGSDPIDVVTRGLKHLSELLSKRALKDQKQAALAEDETVVTPQDRLKKVEP